MCRSSASSIVIILEQKLVRQSMHVSPRYVEMIACVTHAYFRLVRRMVGEKEGRLRR